MTGVRRALRSIATAWLLGQAATLALAPTLLYTIPSECVCTHGADGMCPMHHKASAPGVKVCAMQSATESGGPATLSGLFSVAGLLPAPAEATVLMSTSGAAPVVRSLVVRRPSAPELPPPRA
jgi:hypothetical protein